MPARVCRWEDLPPSGDFDTVLCVGNSLPHARDRLAALRGMAGALTPGGRLVLTSRNWDREQRDERYEVERDGRRALVTYAWTGNDVDIAVTVEGETVAERLTFWPFTHATLLKRAGSGRRDARAEHLGARGGPRHPVIARTGL